MYEEKVISRDSGACTVFHQYAPQHHIFGVIYFRKSLFSVLVRYSRDFYQLGAVSSRRDK